MGAHTLCVRVIWSAHLLHRVFSHARIAKYQHVHGQQRCRSATIGGRRRRRPKHEGIAELPVALTDWLGGMRMCVRAACRRARANNSNLLVRACAVSARWRLAARETCWGKLVCKQPVLSAGRDNTPLMHHMHTHIHIHIVKLDRPFVEFLVVFDQFEQFADCLFILLMHFSKKN